MNNSTIDWNGKLEAVHEDGRVVPVTVRQCSMSPYETNECPEDSKTNEYWYPDGRDYCTGDSGWTIRNVATPQEAEPIKWGEPIKVDGKRPEWLGDDQPVAVASTVSILRDTWYGMQTPSKWWGREFSGDWVSIRLPHDHPHYATQQATPAVPQEVVERMVKLLREQVASLADMKGVTPAVEEARAIVAMLEPVDHDETRAVDLAKMIAKVTVRSDSKLHSSFNTVGKVREYSGRETTEAERMVACMYRGIKEGRALAKEAGE